MATTAIVPYVLSEPFHSTFLKETSTYRTGLKRNAIRRRNIRKLQESTFLENEIGLQDKSLPKNPGFNHRDAEDLKSNNLLESNLSRLTSRVIEKAKRPTYNISAQIYIKKEENFFCSISENSVKSESLNLLNNSNEKAYGDDFRVPEPDTKIENPSDWRTSLRLLQAEIKKVTELPDIISEAANDSRSSVKYCHDDKSCSSIKNGNIETEDENSMDICVTLEGQNENQKDGEVVDSDASILQTALDIRQKYRKNRTIEKLKHFDTPVKYKQRNLNTSKAQCDSDNAETKSRIDGCEDNYGGNTSIAKEDFDKIDFIQEINSTDSTENSEKNAASNASNASNLNRHFGKSLISLKEEDNCLSCKIDSIEESLSINDGIIGCRIEVSNDENISTEIIAQDEVSIEQNGFVGVTLLLEPMITVPDKRRQKDSLENHNDGGDKEPRILQRQRKGIVGVNAIGKNAELDWREELRQRERVKRAKKYGIIKENNTAKIISGEVSQDKYGPGYKPPEKSHVFDWRSCLSNTRDNSAPIMNRTESEKKAVLEKYRIAPKPTPREKWKLLDKASRSSATVDKKPNKEHVKMTKQIDTSNNLSVSSVNAPKTETSADSTISSCLLNDQTHSTTVKVINFVAIKTRSSVAKTKNRASENSNFSQQEETMDRYSINSLENLKPNVDIHETNDVACAEDNSSYTKMSFPDDIVNEDKFTSDINEFDDSMISNDSVNYNLGSIEEKQERNANISRGDTYPTHRNTSTTLETSNELETESIIKNASHKAKEKLSIPYHALNPITIEACQQQHQSKELNKNEQAIKGKSSTLIFSEPQSNFITDKFLLDSMFGTMYSENEKSTEKIMPAEADSCSSSSFKQRWRTRIDCTPPHETKTSSPNKINKLSNSSQICESNKKNYSELLQQSLIDVKKSRARDTISNVLNKHTGFRYY